MTKILAYDKMENVKRGVNMPEGRFYEDYVEQNKKDKTKRIKKKINNRVILFLLVIILLGYLIVLNIQNRTIQKEDDGIKVKSAETYEGFEDITLSDGSTLSIQRVIIEESKGIVYLTQKQTDGKIIEIGATPTNIDRINSTLEIHEEGINLKINTENKRAEEIK